MSLSKRNRTWKKSRRNKRRAREDARAQAEAVTWYPNGKPPEKKADPKPKKPKAKRKRPRFQAFSKDALRLRRIVELDDFKERD